MGPLARSLPTQILFSGTTLAGMRIDAKHLTAACTDNPVYDGLVYRQ